MEPAQKLKGSRHRECLPPPWNRMPALESEGTFFFFLTFLIAYF